MFALGIPGTSKRRSGIHAASGAPEHRGLVAVDIGRPRVRGPRREAVADLAGINAT